jgi:hypothetical protein
MNALKTSALQSRVLKSGIKAGAMTVALSLGIFGLGIFVHGAAQAAETPFAHLAGSWSGQGKITVQNGTSERIRCRGTYRAGETGTTLSLSLRCASDSYKFELGSDITYAGGAITGSWNEATRSIYGQLAGRVNGSNISAQASAVGFNASLSIVTKGNSQSVAIRSPGSEISEVTISMARAGR